MHRRKRIELPTLAAVGLSALWVTAVYARSGAPEQQIREGVILPAATRAQTSGPGGTTSKAGQPSTATPAPGQKLAAEPLEAQAGATFAGDETCLTCHEGQKKGYSNTMHGRLDHPGSPAANLGCETCHGPGSKHVDDPEVPGMIRSFTKDAPKESNEACTTCHTRGSHALWEGSVHEARNLSCSSCHSVHNFKSDRAQLMNERESDTCATCHRDKAAKVDRSGHMPLREGKMECSTCHDPHGATNVKQLRQGDSIEGSCTSCHADKRGPFLWEHAPSRDGCTTCHDPHGSQNDRMLVTKPPILCQRCHVATRHPSTIYDGALIGSAPTPSVRIYARSCVTCHSTIHGSNHPSGQRFTR